MSSSPNPLLVGVLAGVIFFFVYALFLWQGWLM